MNVGMPGLGLGGLFYLICGLAMPALELMSRGRGIPATRGWRAAWMQCALATASLAAVLATVGVVSFIAARLANGFEPFDLAVGILTTARSGISPLSVVLLAFLLSGVDVVHFIARRSARPPARSAHAGSGLSRLDTHVAVVRSRAGSSFARLPADELLIVRDPELA